MKNEKNQKNIFQYLCLLDRMCQISVHSSLIFPCCCYCCCSWYVIVEKKCWIGGERSGEFLMEIECTDPCMETVTTIIRLRQMESKADTRNGVCTPGDKNICTRCTSTWRALDASWKYLPCCTTYMGNRISVITFTINIEFYRPFLFSLSLSLSLASLFPFSTSNLSDRSIKRPKLFTLFGIESIM